MAALIGCAFAVLRLRPLGSPDTWWHLAIGRHVLDVRARVFPDPLGLPAKPEFTAGEWLFDVVAWLLYSAGGPNALIVLAALCAAASFAACLAVARDVVPRAPWTALMAAAVAASVANVRFFPRPHIFFLVLLPLAMFLARRAVRASNRTPWLLALAGLLAVWSQAHPSVVIAPAVIGCAGLPWVLGHRRPGEADARLDAPLFGALGLLALIPLLSPYGLGLIGQVLGHAGTDSVRHIGEMQPMPAGWWWPPNARSLAVLELALGVALLGVARNRRLPLGPLLLVVLGLLMTTNTHRFRSAWAILAVPLLAEGWASVWPWVEGRGKAAATILLAALLWWSASAGWSGPELGLDRDWVPVDLRDALDAFDATGPIFNDYDSGGWIGLHQAPAGRVFIDGRTPPYFTDEHFFAARIAMEDPGAFRRLHRGYGFSAAVVGRQSGTCPSLAADPAWDAVWVSADRALFLAAPQPTALKLLDPCAGSSVAACTPANKAAMLGELAALVDRVPSSAYVARLGAVVALRCAAAEPEAASVFAAAAQAAEPDHPDFAWIAAQVDPDSAHSILADSTDARSAYLRLQKLPDGEAFLTDAWAFLLEHGDESPAALRLRIATVCNANGDTDCAARQSIRAAVLGQPGALDLLRRLHAQGVVPAPHARLVEALLAPGGAP